MRGQVGNESSSFMSTDQDVEDSRSENAQKVSDQSGASKTVTNISPRVEIIIEEKPIDRPKSTMRSQRRAKPKFDQHRIRRSYGALSRSKIEIETDRKSLPKGLSESKLQSRGTKEVGSRGLQVDTDPNEGLAFYESPIVRAMTGQQNWSDDLIDLGGEPSYSGNESSVSCNLIENSFGNSMMLVPDQSPEPWTSQYPTELWRTSWSSSPSVRESTMEFDFLTTSGSQPLQPPEKQRGRLEYRADVGLRTKDDYVARKRLEHSRVKSMPKLEKLMQIPRMNLSYGDLRKRKRSLPELDIKQGISALTSTDNLTEDQQRCLMGAQI